VSEAIEAKAKDAARCIASFLRDPRLVRGLDNNGDGTVTVRWQLVRGGNEVKVSLTVPMTPAQTLAPLELWEEIKPVVDEFVLAAAYGSAIPPEEIPVEAEWRDLPEALPTSP